eukprot:Skav201243  [mRNA]  locus=scaffold3106:53466:55402:- [translate_table: standard]
MEDDKKETSMKERVIGALVTLVNPRFMYFNRPLCLAITVAVLAFLGFWPLFGYYAWTTTTVVTDNNQTDMTVISGPLMELDTVIMEYSRLPSRCTGSQDHHYFSGTREEISSDGLTEIERVCDYDVCILSTYEYTVEAGDYSPEATYPDTTYEYADAQNWDGYHKHTVYVPPYKQTTQMCMIQDEWLEGLVKDSNPFIYMFNQSGSSSNFSCDKGSDGTWCPFEKELEAYRFMADCCEEISTRRTRPNQQLSAVCSVLDVEFPNLNGETVKVSDEYCSPMILDWIVYLEALKNRTNHAFYRICEQEQWKYENPAFNGNKPSCTMTGAWSYKPFSFKLLWTRNEVVTTKTRSPLLDALAKAFALRNQIESLGKPKGSQSVKSGWSYTTRIAVTLLIIVLFRWLGIIKETKEFTWGEIITEKQSAQSTAKDRAESENPCIIGSSMFLEADPDLRGAAASDSPASPEPSSPSTTTIKVAKVTAKVKAVKVEAQETSLPHAPQEP